MTAQTLALVHNRSSQADPDLNRLTQTIPTVLICGHSLLRSGLQQILSGTSFTISEAISVTGPKGFLQVATKPVLIIIGANQTTGGVHEVVKHAKEQFPQARIVVLADQFDLGFVRRAHAAGVNGFCLAATAPQALVGYLELVMLGETVVPAALLRSFVSGAPESREQTLTDSIMAEVTLSELTACKLSRREAEILGCLREGAPNKLIARKLDVTEATIKVHVKAILRKIGATNRTQAAMWASQRLPRAGVSDRNV
jgi:two-component system, NarL family, nitrate/nitrite response regulator NarL